MDIIGGLSSLASGVMNFLGQKEANKINQENAERNIQLQREFAQQGIRWKVADAEAAGVHPLFALGANTTSFSPVSVGATNAMSPLADMAKNLGQDLSRSVDSTRTKEEREGARMDAVSKAGTGLQLENMKLRNDLLRAQISKINASQVGPPMPTQGDKTFVDVPGETSNAGIKAKPLEVSPAAAGMPSSEAGSITDTGWARTPTGLAPVPSKDVKERIEDVMPYEWMHYIRNGLLPNFGFGHAPPQKPAPGYHWAWSHARQEYQQVKNSSRGLWSSRQGWSQGHRWP